MERDIFRLLQQALEPLRKSKPRGQRYSDADIVLIAVWAVLHDRPIDWACRRSSWPPSRYPRALPHQSRMSRRLRTPSARLLLSMVLVGLTHGLGACRVAVLDGRALTVSRFTTDRHAKRGWGRGRFENGYKLHVLIDAQTGTVLASVTTPLHVSEGVVARILLTQAVEGGLLAEGAVILADANYDSNPLHRHAAGLGLRLIAPRRLPGTGLGYSAVGGHHANRLISILATEDNTELRRLIYSVRGNVERVFSTQVCTGGGLRDLPAWVRTMPRVRTWISIKIIIQLARGRIATAA